jgi:hypothetical protein
LQSIKKDPRRIWSVLHREFVTKALEYALACPVGDRAMEIFLRLAREVIALIEIPSIL